MGTQAVGGGCARGVLGSSVERRVLGQAGKQAADGNCQDLMSGGHLSSVSVSSPRTCLQPGMHP